MGRHVAVMAVLAIFLPAIMWAQDAHVVQKVAVADWKAVYGRVESRDRIPARSQLGGVLTKLDVSEGDHVRAGQALARVVDEKLDFQLAALDAQMQVVDAQLINARSELTRGEELLERGVTTAQRLDGLRTQVDVLVNQIDALSAERNVIGRRSEEGVVLSPLAGRVLEVPVAVGAVVLPGEVVAMVGGGGFFLRLAVPERHATALQEGAAIQIEEAGKQKTGRLVRLFPQIENGRVVADVEVAGLSDVFVGKRVLVRLPVGERSPVMIPLAFVETRLGLDFVDVQAGDGVLQRTVLLGQRHALNGVEMVEIVSGLAAGETVVLPHE